MVLTILKQGVNLFSNSQTPLFRKIALSLWGSQGDPSVYGFVELDVTTVKSHSSLLALITKALGIMMQENSKLSTMIKWGHIVQRPDKSISIMVDIPGQQNDLSLLNLHEVHLLSVDEIQQKLDRQANLVRAHRDPNLGPMLKLIRQIPQPLLKFFLNIYEFFIYELNVNLKMRMLPHRPFGSIIVSNVGSLGIKKALLPLVPIARASAMVSIGQVSLEPKVVDGVICIRSIAHLGVTFDHRLFDGSHAGKMVTDFERAFAELVRP